MELGIDVGKPNLYHNLLCQINLCPEQFNNDSLFILILEPEVEF